MWLPCRLLDRLPMLLLCGADNMAPDQCFPAASSSVWSSNFTLITSHFCLTIVVIRDHGVNRLLFSARLCRFQLTLSIRIS